MQEQDSEDRIQDAFRGNAPKIAPPKIIPPKPVIPAESVRPIKPVTPPEQVKETKPKIKPGWEPINFAHKKEIRKGLREEFRGRGIVNAKEINKLGETLRGAKGRKTINKRLKEAGLDKFHRDKLRGLGKMMKKRGTFF
ncbi:MAG: hypothetical protein U1C57_01295 [Candidatus Doudnabacteria bacterium]|nr:hypothetical protein [bacterium]MDZ4243718.1 hypothetical protein [Candidatus Doudnabacteria bacterium]